MYLLENSAAARAMRKNIVQLFRSEIAANRVMALEMIKAGGMPLEVLIDVYHLYFDTWRLSDADAQQNAALADSLIQSALPDHIFQSIKDYVDSIDSRHDPRHRIFRGPHFFDMLITEGIADLQGLVACWKANTAFIEHTDLTWFLLNHRDAIDKNIFIDKRIPRTMLNDWRMKVLLECEDPHFDKTAFLAQYLKNGVLLDLSCTGIAVLPKEVLHMEGIEFLKLQGIRIKEIPLPLLRKLKRIVGSTHTLRAIHRQVIGVEEQDFYYAAKVKFDKAKLDIAAKNYTSAAQKLQSINHEIIARDFSAEEQAQYWQTYFETTFQIGDTEMGMQVLTTAIPSMTTGIQGLPNDLRTMLWWPWYRYMLQWTLDGTIAQWQAAVAPLKALNPAAKHLLSLHDPEFWIRSFRVTISQDRLADARRVLLLAQQHASEDVLHRFPWYLYFKRLQQLGQYEEIAATWAQYHATLWRIYQFWRVYPKRIGEMSAIWIEAFIRSGQYKNAEILCSAMISYFHQIPQPQRNPLLATFIDAQQNAVDAYRFLARIYAVNRPSCAQYFGEMAHKYQDPNRLNPSLLEKVLAYVNSDYNPDFWSEVERPKMVEMLGKLNQMAWATLELRWVELEIYGKKYLADALHSVQQRRSIRLLCKMLSDDDPGVGATVAMALLELDYVWNPKVSILSDLQRHHANTIGYEQAQIAKLIARQIR